MKGLETGIAGDAVSCACDVQGGFLNDSEKNKNVSMGSDHVLFCGLLGKRADPQLVEGLCASDCAR